MGEIPLLRGSPPLQTDEGGTAILVGACRLSDSDFEPASCSLKPHFTFHALAGRRDVPEFI
jgi:hypothetical protein